MSRQRAIELKIKRDRRIALEAGRRLARCDPADAIVVSGISGCFPDSDGLPDFADNLFGKVDVISDDDRRWTIGKRDARRPAARPPPPQHARGKKKKRFGRSKIVGY